MASSLQEILLTGSPDGPITAYDSSSGATLAHFNGSRSPRKGLALVGKKLIGASHVSSDTGTGSIHLYNWWSSTAFYRLPVPEPVAPLAATLDGLYLYAGGISGHIHALSINSGNLVQSVDAHCKPVSCLEINSDGSLLLSGSDDGTIAVYPIYQLLDASSSQKTSSHSVLQRFVGHDSPVTAITTGIGGCNCTIISSSLDCTCKFWSLRQGFPLRTLTFTCAILGVVMDPIESAFYAAGSDGSIYVGALVVPRRQLVKHGKEFIKWGQKHGGPVIAISMLKEGQILISASEYGSIWFWQVGTGQVIKVLGEKNRSISDLVVAKGFDEFVDTYSWIWRRQQC